MRFECALIGVLAIAGCQHQRGYTATCPHCNQAHAVVNNQGAPASTISPVTYPVTYTEAEVPPPIPKNFGAAFAPVPSVPGVEE